MEDEADNILAELETVLSKIRLSPVTDMTEEMLDTFLVKLDGITEDAENCVAMFSEMDEETQDGP